MFDLVWLEEPPLPCVDYFPKCCSCLFHVLILAGCIFFFSSVEVHTITVLWMDQVGSEHLGLFCFWRWCKSWNSCSMDQYYQYQALPWRRHVSHPLKLFSWSSVICAKFSTDNIFGFSFVRLGHPWFSLILLRKRAFCSTKRMHLKHSTNRFCGETWCIAVFIK